VSVEYIIPLLPWLQRLSGNTFKVAVRLADLMLHTKKARERRVELGTVARSYARLADETDLSRGTVLKAGRELEEVGLFEVRRPGGVNAQGHGRGGYKVVNTFKALYAPCVRKETTAANDTEPAPYGRETVQDARANGANYDDQTVQDLHTDPVKEDPVKDPVGDRGSVPPIDVPPSSGIHPRAREIPRPKMAKPTRSVFFVGTRGRPLQRFLAEQFIPHVMRVRGCNELETQAWLLKWCEFVDLDHLDDEADSREPDPANWWRRRFKEWLTRQQSATPITQHPRSKTVGNDDAVDAFVRAHQRRAEEG
jgi:hypothetical protein